MFMWMSSRAGSIGKLPASISRAIASSPRSDGPLLVGAEQAPVVEHAGVGEREPDVVAGERLVEVDGGGEALDGGVRGGLEAATPELWLMSANL